MSFVDINLWDFLDNSANRYPKKTAIKENGASCTYEQLRDRTLSVAAFIKSHGLLEGDRAAVLSPNCLPFVEVMFANARLGVVTELLNWRLAPARLCELVEQSSAKLVFFSEKTRESYEILRKKVKRPLTYVCMDADIPAAVSNTVMHSLPPMERNGGPGFNAPAMLIYSSGTTSAPKAMIHSVKNIVLKALILVNTGTWTQDDVYLLTSPLFHSSCVGLFACIAAGATCIIGKPSPDGIINAVVKDRATRIGVVPSVLNTILDYLDEHPDVDCSSVRCIEYGAAPMSAQQIARSMRHFDCGFYQYYGMTETAATVTALLPAHHLDESKLKSVGLPVLGTRIKVVNDSGGLCEPGEIGEIIVRHPCTINEYLDNPELTKSAIHGEWYSSGDLGYMDSEGFLYIVDRKGDLIITGGENVYPKEIASCIMELPGVADVAVTGVPDERFGEAVMAAVVRAAGSDISAEEIQDHCREHMASYKKPRYIYFVDALPLNSTGKVDKKAVKSLHIDK